MVNKIPGLLLERGAVVRQGRRYVEEAPPDILEDATPKLSWALRMLLSQLKQELGDFGELDRRGGWNDGPSGPESESCRRLTKIPGIGPVAATALVAAIGNGRAFRKGRDFSPGWAWWAKESITGGEQSCSASVNAETAICGDSSFRGRGR